MEGYQNSELCKECGGQCCKFFPGAYFPGDYGFEVENLKENLLKAFRSGKVAVDLCEGDPRGWPQECPDAVPYTYYIRPKRRVHRSLIDYILAGDSACIHLTERGCELPFEQRPLNCRMLEPRPRHLGCTAHGYHKEKAAQAWFPYEKIIKAAMDQYFEEGGE